MISNAYKRVLLFALIVSSSASGQTSSLWDQIPENVKSRNAFKRFEWFYRQRAWPSDTIPVEHYYRERSREMAKHAAVSPSALSWTPIGPRGLNSTWPPLWGEMSGRVRGVAIHPTNPNIVYIGAAGGGIWKTTNGGTSWTSVSDNFPNITFGAIAIDPNNTNVVYAGTGEVVAGASLQSYDGRGLFKSTDAGATWSQITNGFGTQTAFGDIDVSPSNSNIVLAALGRGYLFLGAFANEGIWRSTDAGTTWTRVLSSGVSTEIAFHPTTSGRVFAAGWTGGVYVSTDNGATWTASSSGLPTASLTRVQLSIAPSQPATMYAFISSNNGSLTRAYKSINDGANWSQISSGVQLGGNYDGTNWIDQGWYDATIAVKPNDPNFVLLGNIEVHRSTDGATFSPLRSASGPYGGTRAWDNMTHTDIHRIVFAPSNSNIAYLGCDGGVYKSTDGGNTWNSANTFISTIQYYRIASHPTNRNIVIGGAQDNGNYRTTDGGATPWAITTTGDGMECLFDYVDPNYVYVSTQNGNLLRSTSGGAYGTFFQIVPAWEVTPNWTTPLIIHPTNNNILYTGSRRIWRTTNRGSSWTAITGSIASSDVFNSIAIGRTHPNTLIASAGGYSNANPQVFVSTDAGFNWNDVTTNISGAARYVARVLVHPLDGNTMYVLRSGFGSGKVYQSFNLGQTWTNVSGNLPDVPATDFFIDPQRPRYWYVATDVGVYSTTNGGATWDRDNTGMPTVPMMDFDYFSSGGTRLLRLGTHGRSAYEAALALETSASIFASPISKSIGKIETNTSDTTVATIYNFGTQPLTVSSITKNNASFILSGLPSLPANVPSQGSIQFRIIFRPTAHGAVTDSVRIASNDPNFPTIYIPLSGSGVLIGTALKGTLYGAGNGSLYAVNTSTGAATVIGATGVLQMDALTIRPATRELYGISSSTNSTQFYRVSSQFGDALPLRSVPLGNLRGIAFSNSDQLYATNSTGSLYRINLATGDSTFIGNSSGIVYAGLSFSPISRELWASVRPPVTNRDRIYKVNTTLGATTLIGATGDGAITPSISFNALGVLFGLKGLGTQTNSLIRIDTTTGVGTTIGSLGIASVTAIAMRTDSSATSVDEVQAGVPNEFALHQNYPNPFNPTTKIAFDLPSSGFVSLKVYDIVGREVITLVDEFQSAGFKFVTFDARRLASGVYLYKLEAGKFSATKKLTLVR